MTVGDAFLNWVVPALGGIIGVLMFASPLMAVLRARRDRVLGDLNPLPFPMIFANCCGWVAYGYVIKDVMVYWPNQIGLLLGLFFVLSCYGLADTKTRDRQMAIMLFFSGVLSLLGGVCTLVDLSSDQRKSMWGFTSNAILLIYYASPLSTILTVVRTRSSSSLHLPLCVMNVINGSLWVIYGAARKDLFIAVPNGIGALLGLVLVALVLLYPAPKKARSSPAVSDSEATINSHQPLSPTAEGEDMEAQPHAASGTGSPQP